MTTALTARYGWFPRSVVGLAGALLMVALTSLGIAADAAPGAASLYAKMPTELAEPKGELADQHREAFARWETSLKALGKLRASEQAFGTRKRAAARRDGARLRRESDKLAEACLAELRAIKAEYREEWDDLKEDELRLTERMDYAKMASPVFKRQQEQVKEIGAKMTTVDNQVKVFDWMIAQVSDLAEGGDFEGCLFKIEPREYAKVVAEVPALVEARRVVQDHVADLAVVRAMKETDKWDERMARVLVGLERGLPASIQALHDEAEKTRQPHERDLERLQRKLERVEAKLAKHDAERTREEQKALAEEIKPITTLLGHIAVLEAVGPDGNPATKEK